MKSMFSARYFLCMYLFVFLHNQKDKVKKYISQSLTLHVLEQPIFKISVDKN